MHINKSQFPIDGEKRVRDLFVIGVLAFDINLYYIVRLFGVCQVLFRFEILPGGAHQRGRAGE